MAFQSVPDTIGVEVRGTLLGQEVENTLYYNYIAVPDESELLTLVNDLGDVFEELWLDVLPLGFEAREIYARDLAAPITVQATNASIAGMDGTYTGDTMPSLLTLAIARRSGLTGRGSRGRIFWMGLSESMVSNNVVGSGVADLMVDALIAMDVAANTLGFTPVIVSRYIGSTPRVTALTFPLVSWSYNDLQVDTRRSRKPGSGS